jgi:organic hydroperoxide reductase OsmC/OhrA
MSAEHHYEVIVTWTGNRGQGTKDYQSYERSHTVTGKNKPDLLLTADPMFRGDPTKYNPEELLLTALSSCHMLSYLHLCDVNKIIVTQYIDKPTGVMVLESSFGHFTEAVLRPVVTITEASKIEEAKKLHHIAHEKCFIANSINFPVHIEPDIRI